jgi:hypothetical protein
VYPKLTQSGGFAGRRDRQLSTVSELQSILDAPFPSCRANPCTRIPADRVVPLLVVDYRLRR